MALGEGAQQRGSVAAPKIDLCCENDEEFATILHFNRASQAASKAPRKEYIETFVNREGGHQAVDASA